LWDHLFRFADLNLAGDSHLELTLFHYEMRFPFEDSTALVIRRAVDGVIGAESDETGTPASSCAINVRMLPDHPAM
jgi:hypothetical protein